MRRGVLILILALGCASGTPHRQALRVEVSEQRGQRIMMTGPHIYLVSLDNASTEPIEVESISLAPSGPSDYSFEDAFLTVGDVMSPGETRQYQMFVTIVAQGRGSAQFTSNIDAVSVTIPCKSDSGNFVDSEVVSISRR